MSHSRPAFTLIELLVVIAIIGVLSATVLVSLNAARTKGGDAAVKGNLSNARTQAELFYSVSSDSFANVCANTTVSNVKSIYSMVLAAAQAAGLSSFSRDTIGTTANAVCNDIATGWAAQVPLKSPAGVMCVDSNGTSATSTASLLTTAADVSC